MKELWYGGFNGSMDVLFPEGNYDYFKLDADYNLPETNRQNNYLRRNGILKKMEPLKLQWLASVDNPNRTQLFFTPLSGWNYYDGFTPGLALYNSVFFPKKNKFHFHSANWSALGKFLPALVPYTFLFIREILLFIRSLFPPLLNLTPMEPRQTLVILKAWICAIFGYHNIFCLI